MRKNKIVAFLLSLVAALALWVYAVTFVNPDDTTSISDIRLRFTGSSALASRGLMLTGGEKQYIDVEISGRRSDLKELNSSNVEAVADLSNIDTAGTFEVTWTLNPPATVASGDIRLISANTNRVKVKVSERRDRDIPVEIVYTKGNLPDGYLQGATELTLQTIPVSGPSEEVMKIAKAAVEVDLNKVTENINEQMEYTFVDEDGKAVELSEYTVVEAESVGVSIQILPYRDIALDVKLVDGGGLTSTDVKAKISPTSVRVTGTAEALEQLADTHFVQVDLKSVQGIKPDALSIQVELPQGVVRWYEDGTSTSKFPAEINLQISPNVSLIELPLSKTKLEWVNGEEGKEYFYEDADQMIQIRGDRMVLRQIESGALEVVVEIDISNAVQPQVYSLKIRLPHEKLGVFAEYTARIGER